MKESKNPKEEIKEQVIALDLQKLYASEDLQIVISQKQYSNHVYIQSSGDDLCIDFLEFPGIKNQNGTIQINGTRIYLARENAIKISHVLSEFLSRQKIGDQN